MNRAWHWVVLIAAPFLAAVVGTVAVLLFAADPLLQHGKTGDRLDRIDQDVTEVEDDLKSLTGAIAVAIRDKIEPRLASLEGQSWVLQSGYGCTGPLEGVRVFTQSVLAGGAYEEDWICVVKK